MNRIDQSWKSHYLLTRAMKKLDSTLSQQLLLYFLSNRKEGENNVVFNINDIKKIYLENKGGKQKRTFDNLFLETQKDELQKVFQKSIIHIPNEYFENSSDEIELSKMPHFLDENGKIHYYDIHASIIKTILVDNTNCSVIVRFNEDLIPFLDPIKRYIWISLDKVIKLRSKYAYKLYLYCKSKLDENQTDVLDDYKVYIYKTDSNPSENLESWLDFEAKNSYSVFSKIEQRILIPAITEINEVFSKDKELYIQPKYKIVRNKEKNVEYIKLSFKRKNEKFIREKADEQFSLDLNSRFNYENNEKNFFNDLEKNIKKSISLGLFDEIENEDIIDVINNINKPLNSEEIFELIRNNTNLQKYILDVSGKIIDYEKWKFLIIRKIIYVSEILNGIEDYSDLKATIKILEFAFKDIPENFKGEKNIIL